LLAIIFSYFDFANFYFHFIIISAILMIAHFAIFIDAAMLSMAFIFFR